MDLREFIRVIRRRWYVTVLVVLISVGTGWEVTRFVGPQYSAVTTAVLIPPKSTVDNAARLSNYAPANPLLYLGGLNQSRDLLLRKMWNKQVTEVVASAVPGGEFEAAADPTSSGPIVVVTARASTGPGALQVIEVLKREMQLSLQQVQQELHISADNQIGLLSLTTDAKATVERKQQMQFAVMAAAVALMTGLLLIAALDSLLEQSRTRRRKKSNSRPDASLTSPEDPQRSSSRFDDARGDSEPRSNRGRRGLREPVLTGRGRRGADR